jgi:hypothetical protein
MRIITEAFDELGEAWVYFSGTDTSYDQMNTAIAQLKNAIDAVTYTLLTLPTID